MKDIKCPSCGKTFKIDPTSYEEILLQIKNDEFNKEIEQRLFLKEETNKKATELLKQELKIKLIEQNRINETKIQALESKLTLLEEQKANSLNELRNKASLSKFGERYNDLNKSDQKQIRKMYPQKISEAEPKNIGGNL